MSERDGDSEHGPNTKDSPVFSPADRLLLLQLQTRRAIADRTLNTVQRRVVDESDTSDAKGRQIPEKWRLLDEGTTLHQWQASALASWSEQGKGTIKVATGGGKTTFALAAAERLQNTREPLLRLVIVVPTIPLMYQWYDELRKGNLPEGSIGMMGGGRELPPLKSLRILIAVLNSARDRLPAFVAEAGWADSFMLIVDECHRANALQARRIFDSQPKFTLGLSATPEQDGDSDTPANDAYDMGPVGAALGPIIFEFSLKESLEAGLLTQFEVNHIGLPLSATESTLHGQLSREISDLRKQLQARYSGSRSQQNFLAWCQTVASRGGQGSADAERFLDLANRRKRLLYSAEARTRAVLDLLASGTERPEGRAIVFHESVQDIEAIFLEALKAGLPAVLEHSQLPDSVRAENINAFREGVAQIIISARSLVEGFNVPSADLGVIAASTSSVRQRIQSLGRMLRRKADDRGARIVVLYVKDTEDEAIYERADWESVIGAERNLYFNWTEPAEGASWEAGLVEVASPPRTFRPSSWDVDVSGLKLGDEYPGQVNGVDLSIDAGRNLRTQDGQLVGADPSLLDNIVRFGDGRRARYVPAGHVLVRPDIGRSRSSSWLFAGVLGPPLPIDAAPPTSRRFKLVTVGGRKQIALQRGREQIFARGADSARNKASGEARDLLLAWIKDEVSGNNAEPKELFEDGEGSYWLEFSGERFPYPNRLEPLEFE